ncbi:MAG: dTMP kinase [Paracoccaceae bacterium]|nr:dTMP kinase [Paracoccaceae bacterium]MDE2760122.1 dTMP kinase [Paracoccaceae bacterium]MDE2916427.1 dTMP kinase [Paracoccaceae bacterium]MYE36973.1 dTMP kinase [Paracoccaceae bacterium]
MAYKGKFITFEGIDGAGKSTQVKLLQQNLNSKGFDCIVTREPGGSTGSEKLRKILVDKNKYNWSNLSELLLFFAARKDHVEKTILPALNDGKIVICDRFTDSTRVYQSQGKQDLGELIELLQSKVIQLDPDLTFILRINSEISLQRTNSRQDGDWRVSSLSSERLMQVINGFSDLTKQFPNRCFEISTETSLEESAKKILERTMEILE